ELVVWLVEQHLNLSATAQKQDISDPDVIATFAAKIKNDRYLVALYLLTVADVRGTSPKVWNAWKAKLMEDLFLRTRRYLSDGKSADRLGEIRADAAATLNLYALPAATYQLLWAQLEDSYFLDHEAQEIAWHTRLLAFKTNAATAIVSARLSRAGEGLQVLVYCPDQRALFARICDFFARMNYTIVEAKIHTTRHNYALNSFQIMQASVSNTSYRDIMAYIEYELVQDIQLGKAIHVTASGRVNRQLKHFPIGNKVNLETASRGLFMLSFLGGDRPGLLARIAQIFDQHQVRLHRAKINTLGSRAEDVFWLSGSVLDHPAQSATLLSELLEKV
ncbi:MAG: bifunctional uridylyltransferase/uridylyl-removing protein, partial [Sideroxydans sp.]|nr:bifunctional uridylyltransferase/uridylyl-removing protein [Sideroxydans sp.]